MSVNEYIFPFTTCEIPSDNYIAQPFSFLTNVLSAFGLWLYYHKANYKETKFLIKSFIVFEFVHAIHHAVHFSEMLQTYTIHFLFYGVCYATYGLFVKLTSVKFNLYQSVILYIIILLDLFVFFKIGGGWIITSGISILVYIVVSYIPYFPSDFMKRIKKLLIAAGVSQIFLINEIFNCKTMMNIIVFPYHVILELFAMYIFIELVDGIIKWEHKYIRFLKIKQLS